MTVFANNKQQEHNKRCPVNSSAPLRKTADEFMPNQVITLAILICDGCLPPSIE